MMIEWDVTIPKLSGEKTRRVYICLPESYEENEEKRYPVMYMFDGHNIFYDAVSAFGNITASKRLISSSVRYSGFSRSPRLNFPLRRS